MWVEWIWKIFERLFDKVLQTIFMSYIYIRHVIFRLCYQLPRVHDMIEIRPTEEWKVNNTTLGSSVLHFSVHINDKIKTKLISCSLLIVANDSLNIL